jgi:hypothetical protein
MGITHTADSNLESETVKIEYFKVSVKIKESEIKQIEVPFRKMN